MRLMTESDGERRVRFRYFVLIVGFSVVWPTVMVLEAGTFDWPLFVAGAVLNAAAVGPFADTATAERINGLGGEPGSVQRILAIAVMAVVVWLAVTILQPSAVTLGSFVAGGMAALLVVSVVRQITS